MPYPDPFSSKLTLFCLLLEATISLTSGYLGGACQIGIQSGFYSSIFINFLIRSGFNHKSHVTILQYLWFSAHFYAFLEVVIIHVSTTLHIYSKQLAQ